MASFAPASSTWSSLAWRGFASVILGLVALAWPGITLDALTLLYGAYAFADGVLAIVFATQRECRPQRGWLVLEGLCGVGAGIATVLWPAITLLVLVLLVGVRALVVGVLEIVVAIRLRKAIAMPVLYGIVGVLSIAFGIVTFAVPIVSAFALVTILGAYALAFGVIHLGLAFQIRRSTHPPSMHAAAT